MCHFITATLPPNADEAAVRQLAQSQLLNWVRIDNPPVARQLRKDEAYFLTTRGMCDCGTALGRLSRIDRPTKDDIEGPMKKLRKLRRKGWGEQKLQRWLGEKQASLHRKQVASDRASRSNLAEAVRWIDFMRSVTASRASAAVGVLLHWYEGWIESEQIAIARRVSVRLESTEPHDLLSLQEDVLYEFHG